MVNNNLLYLLLYCSGRFGTIKDFLKKLSKVNPARLKLRAFFILWLK